MSATSTLPRNSGGGNAALFVLGLLLTACATTPPRPADPALAAATAVLDIRSGAPPRCDATGAAVHLGAGRYVTAAHVVDGSVQRLRGDCPPGPPALTLAVRGNPAAASLLRAGRDRIDRGIGQRYLAGEDIALIRPAPGLPQHGAATLCAADPPQGAMVLLVSSRRALRTRISGTHSDADPAFGSYLEIPVTLEAGDSGGAVFEATTGCLAGLVSHRDQDGGPPRTRLVPASTIRRFLGA